MIQLSNPDEKVIELLKRVIAPGQGPAGPTQPPPVLVHHTILNEQQTEELLAAYRAGDTIAELRAQFGIGKNSLYRHLKRAGITPDRT